MATRKSTRKSTSKSIPAKPKLGSGGRFRAGVQSIEKREGLSEEAASAIMAKAGRAKYGAKRMSGMAAAGRRRAAKRRMY